MLPFERRVVPSRDFFAPARRLYTRHGFTECGPFGGYVLDPHSRFFTRVL